MIAAMPRTWDAPTLSPEPGNGGSADAATGSAEVAGTAEKVAGTAEVVPGILRIEAPLGDRANALFVLHAGGTPALHWDTGTLPDPPGVLSEALRARGTDPARLRFVVNSHADVDHMGGNRAVRALAPSALLMCGEAGRPAFPPTYRHVDDYLATLDRIEALAPDILLASHEPVMRAAEVAAFLAASRDFARALDNRVRAALRGAPWSLADLASELGPRTGEWPAEAHPILRFPLLGHLERLVVRGEAHAERVDGRLVYRLARA